MLRVLLLLPLLHQASAACYKHVSCTSCIAESNDAGSCMWYTQPHLDGIGACVAGRPGYHPPMAMEGQLAVEAYGTWSMELPTGETAHFRVNDLDQTSEGSCYTTGCVHAGQCDPGYYAVSNQPCYSDNVFPDWRELQCCRQQRNINGYLRGFEAEAGIIQGKLFYAACCATCYPGEVIVGCHAYAPGECQSCAAGRFNPDTTPGSECQACQPCGAGMVRRGCGPSTAGVCEECCDSSVGGQCKEWKPQGLEGSYSDQCQPCADCPKGYMRVGCGGAEPGYCVPCQGGSFFASPICRTCFACIQGETRHGCGGQQIGVCTECPKGKYEFLEACLGCDACTDAVEEEADGFHLKAPMARVGCGGHSTGKCARLAARLDLQDATKCPSAVDANALCEGAQISARFTVRGLSLRQLDAEYGDCSAATGLCLSGFFRVKLLQRQVDAFDGQEVADLGDFFTAELEPISGLDDPNAIMAKRGLQLPEGLLEASGYFLRIFFFDATGSCCSATSTSLLFADSEDFSVEGQEYLVQEEMDLSSEEISAGLWEDAHTRMATACRVTATPSSWITCETAKALQLGLPAGQRAIVPLPLLHSAGSAQVAALGAAFPVKEAGQRLVDIELAYAATMDIIPANASEWRAIMDPLFQSMDRRLQAEVTGPNATTSTTSTTFTTSAWISFTPDQALARLEALRSGALQLQAAADQLHGQWSSELSSCASLLPQKLHDLQEIDKIMGDSAQNASFDIVRLAQSVSWKFAHELHVLQNSTATLEVKETAMAELLQRLGAAALLMMGTWGNSWYHGIEWRLKAELGQPLLWPPFGVPADVLGGAERPPGSVSPQETKKRVWQRLEEVAQDMFSYGDELLLAISTQTTTSTTTTTTTTTAETTTTTPTTSPDTTTMPATTPAATTEAATTTNARRLSFSTRSLSRVLPTVRGVVQEVIDVTEKVLEPLSREGAQLFAGALPNISVPGTSSCNTRGWCLSFATEFFSEELIIDDVWEGFGAQAVRPWVDPRVEDLRLKKASEEMLALAWGRIRILEEFLLQLVDLRYLQIQPHVAENVASQSQALANHLDRLMLWAYAPQNVTILSDRPEALWHWQELAKLRQLLAQGRRSAAVLARRRLSRVEALSAWVAGQKDDGYFAGPASWSWRQPWTPWSPRSPGSPSGTFFAASAAAAAKLEASIDEKELISVTHAKAYLRMDVSASSRPITYAGLKHSGSAVVRLQAPADKTHLMMHAEARAFLISPSDLVEPLPIGPESGDAPSGAYPEPHVELRLKRLAGAFQVAAVEPPMEGSVPFVTRHERRDCALLPQPERHPEIVPAALLPLDGFWVLTARDGLTGRLLDIDEGTTLRLLFELDVPDGTPPWRLLSDTTDVLYKMAEDGRCEGLRPIFGSAPETSTFPSTTRTTLYTSTATTIALIPTTTRPSVVVVPEGEEDLVLAPKHSTSSPPFAAAAPWSPPVWFYASLFLLALLGCGIGARCYVLRRRRKMVEVLPEELEEGRALETEHPAPTILTDSKDSAALRAVADAKSGDNPYLAMAKKNPKKQASRKGSSWEVNDTPREGDDEDTWSEASTPENSDGESSASGSSEEPMVSPRTALAANALQQHAQQFSPDLVAAKALSAHAAGKKRQESDDSAASGALQAHAGLFAERGGSKSSKAREASDDGTASGALQAHAGLFAERGGSKSSKAREESDDGTASGALQAHAGIFAERGGSKSSKAREESDDGTASGALQAHARLFEGEERESEAKRLAKGGSLTSKATAQFGPKPRKEAESSESSERDGDAVGSKQSSKQSSKHSKQSSKHSSAADGADEVR